MGSSTVMVAAAGGASCLNGAVTAANGVNFHYSGGGGGGGSGGGIGARRFVASGFVFFVGCFVLYGLIAASYARLFTPHYARAGMSSLGCREDNEGSWSIGVFYGDSPFSLKPIETVSLYVIFIFTQMLFFFSLFFSFFILCHICAYNIYVSVLFCGGFIS